MLTFKPDKRHFLLFRQPDSSANLRLPPLSEDAKRVRACFRMCDKCEEIDKKIEHYRRISSSITDQFTINGIKELIVRLEAQKAALHPDQSR